MSQFITGPIREKQDEKVAKLNTQLFRRGNVDEDAATTQTQTAPNDAVPERPPHGTGGSSA